MMPKIENSIWQILGLTLIIFALFMIARLIPFIKRRILISRLNKKSQDTFTRTQLLAAVRDTIKIPYQFSKQSENKADLVSDMLGDYLSPENLAYRFYMIFGPGGSGKSTFVIQLLREFYKEETGKYQMLALSCNAADLAERIAQIENPEHTILVLDAIDEIHGMNHDQHEKLEEILMQSNNFFKVVMTSRDNFFPDQIEKKYEEIAMRWVGEEHAFSIFKIYLSPWDETRQYKFIGQHYGSNGRAKKVLKQLQAEMPAITGLPLILNYLNSLYEHKVYRYPFQVWAEWVDAWIETQLKSKTTQINAEDFKLALIDLARAAQQEWTSKKRSSLPSTLYIEIFQKHGIEPSKPDGVILELDSRQNIVFSHVTIGAYLLAWGVFENHIAGSVLRSPAWNDTLSFFGQMTWNNYARSFHQSEEMGGFYRTESSLEKIPLQKLGYRDLSVVTRIYLNRYRQTDLRFLRSLTQLKGLYLINGEEIDLKGDWQNHLPHHDMMFYLIAESGNLEVYRLEEEEGYPMPVLVESQVNPDLSRQIIARGSRIDSRRFLTGIGLGAELWDVNHQVLYDKGYTEDGDRYELYEHVLGDAVFGIFDKVRLHVFKENEEFVCTHMVLVNTFLPTLWQRHLSDLVNTLHKFLSDDDELTGLINPDDLVQMEDGFWGGRSWTWKRSDNYPHPISLYMHQPNLFTMEILGLYQPEQLSNRSDE